METYTVSFFGHRTVSNPARVRDRLKEIIKDIITTKENVKFLVGEEGFFDIMCWALICDIKKELDCKNTSLVLVLPYMRANYRKHPEKFLKNYDEVEICEESSKAYPKAAIGIRNKKVIDRSDLVVCCIERNEGGAYTAVKYAKKQQKNIINIAENATLFVK